MIEAFNAQADMGHLLEQQGYASKGRNRWMWPGSTSGLAGVTLMADTGRVYSHHPGDPLAGEHSHDAFSVWCTLVHGGNFAAAVKDAARTMGMAHTKAEPVDFSGLMIDSDTGEIIQPAPLLKPVSVFDVLTNRAPPTAFVWEGYLPCGVVSLWGAHGGAGKSTCALMLAVAVVTGRPLFGVNTSAGPTVFVSLEDAANIVRDRLADICLAWGIDPRTLTDRLHIVDGTENPELFSDETSKAGEVTPAYKELVQLVKKTRAGLVVVDNASDSFGGDEINRRQVRGFMRALGQVARLTDCAVCLLAHVDKNTIRGKHPEGGEGYSGSTAWHNSARSRLFMTRKDDGPLTLEHQKSNLGKRREPVTLMWPDGGLPMLAGDAPNFDGLNARAQGRADDEKAAALLKLIAEFESLGQYASPSATARNKVHALLRVDPAFQRLKLNRDDCARIVNQCQRAGWLEPLEYKSAHTRKYCQRWTVTSTGRDFAGLPAPTAPTYEGGTGGIARTHEGAEVLP